MGLDWGPLWLHPENMMCARERLMPVRSMLSIRLGERRLKITELARQTGISRGTLTRLYHDEADRVDLDVLARLCAALGCSVADLLEYRPEA
jgi:putative transcriptional regulator